MKIIFILLIILFYFIFGLMVTAAMTEDLWRTFDWYKNLSKKSENTFKVFVLIFWPIFGICYLVLIGCCWLWFLIRDLLEDVFDIYI